MLPETLPPELVQREKIISYSDAVLGMHFPETAESIEKARERLAFEELFQLLLASQYNKQANAQLEGWHIPFNQQVVKDFVSHLPFALTNAQRVASWDILQDFEKKVPMNRLLQGDVGAGKTVVAGLAARQAAHEGFQTALMAPTEILARQHAATLEKLLSPFGVSVGSPTSRIVIANPGTYNAQFSAQLDKTDAGADDVTIWLRINGADLPRSATDITLQGNNQRVVAAWNWVYTFSAGQYFQLIWSSLDASMRLLSEGTSTSPTRPAVPSVILTATQVGAVR
jgi:hypothetical protein